MSYKNTFIVISDDSAVTSAVIPTPKNGKPTIASIEYDLIRNNPYKFTQEEVQFKTYLIKNQLMSNNIEKQGEQFFTKSKACFRASPLVKSYEWGIHYDAEGKVSIYDVQSKAYRQFLNSDKVTILKGMRAKRK